MGLPIEAERPGIFPRFGKGRAFRRTWSGIGTVFETVACVPYFAPSEWKAT